MLSYRILIEVHCIYLSHSGQEHLPNDVNANRKINTQTILRPTHLSPPRTVRRIGTETGAPAAPGKTS
uniref:Uncharacterized protein n=1 Tax=Anguilla anguilla TaxID=7936 RepID=A0A0E9S792_ANGAN